MANIEQWADGPRLFARATYQATNEGVSEARAQELLLNGDGYVIVDVQGTDRSWDLGGSAARTAIGLGLLATTGFGFLAAKRRPGQLVVLYEKRHPSNAERAARQQLNTLQIQRGADIRQRNAVWRRDLSAARQLESGGALEQAVPGYQRLFHGTPPSSDVHDQAYKRLVVVLRKLKRYADEATVAAGQVSLLEDARRRGENVSEIYLARARDRVARASELERKARE